MKRFTSLFLVAIMLVMSLSITAFAASDAPDDAVVAEPRAFSRKYTDFYTLNKWVTVMEDPNYDVFDDTTVTVALDDSDGPTEFYVEIFQKNDDVSNAKWECMLSEIMYLNDAISCNINENYSIRVKACATDGQSGEATFQVSLLTTSCSQQRKSVADCNSYFLSKGDISVTTFSIKLLAVVAMTLHHIALIFGQSGLVAVFPFLTLHASREICHILEAVSRIAFPLFAFLLAEGMGKTRSMPKYIGRLGLFALISEPIYYFATRIRFNPKPTFPGFLSYLLGLNFGNVLFTMTLAAAAVFVSQRLEQKYPGRKWIFFAPILLIAAFLGAFLHCDYGVFGVLLIGVLYLFPKKWQRCTAIGVWATLVYILGKAIHAPLSAQDFWNWGFALLSWMPILLYQGKRGRGWKWGFYLYYPAHLLVLTAAQILLA